VLTLQPTSQPGSGYGADLAAGNVVLYNRVRGLADDVVRCGGDAVAVAHRAVLHGNVGMLRVLLEHGADNKEDALSCAAALGLMADDNKQELRSFRAPAMPLICGSANWFGEGNRRKGKNRRCWRAHGRPAKHGKRRPRRGVLPSRVICFVFAAGDLAEDEECLDFFFFPHF